MKKFNTLSFRLLIPYLLIFFVLIAFGKDIRSNYLNENRVKERVTQYLDLFFGGNYEKAWAMLLDVVKTPFKWTKERWVGQWKKNPPKEKLLSVRFKDVKIVQKDGHYAAYVYMFLKFEILDINGKKIIEEREVPDLWGFENNDWYRFEQD